MRVPLTLAVATILVAGCANAPAPAVSAQNGRTWEHRCPPAGTVLQTSNGTTVTFTDTAGPGLCRRADGRTALYGIWTVWPDNPRPDVHAWLGDLFPARAGRTSHRARIEPELRTGNSYLYTSDARIAGFETVDVPAGRFDAVVIEWEYAGTGSNYHRTRHRRWLDTATGVLVKSEARVLGGRGDEHAWHAVSITQSSAAAQARNPAVVPTLDRPRSAQRSIEPLTQEETRRLVEHVYGCVRRAGYDPGAFHEPFAVRVQVDRTGKIRAVVPSAVSGPATAQSQPYAAVRSGLVHPACDPLPLPASRYAAVMNAALRFVPNGQLNATDPRRGAP